MSWRFRLFVKCRRTKLRCLDFFGGRIGIGTGSETGLEIAKIHGHLVTWLLRGEKEENSTEKGGAAGKKLTVRQRNVRLMEMAVVVVVAVCPPIFVSGPRLRKSLWQQQLQQRQQHQQVVFGDLSDGWGAGVEPRNDKSNPTASSSAALRLPSAAKETRFFSNRLPASVGPVSIYTSLIYVSRHPFVSLAFGCSQSKQSSH